MPRHSGMSPLATVAASLVITLTAATSAVAQNDFRGKPVAVKDTGMFGLTVGRVARIDAVNLGASPGDVTLAFFDADGNLVAEKMMTLAPGESGDLEFMGKKKGEQGGRTSIRAHASILDHSREGAATRCGRTIRTSAVVLAPETGQTLRKVRVIHRDMGVCGDKGRKAADQVKR